MKYRYVASQPDGRIVEGDVNAKDVSEVLAFLSTNGLRPVSVKPLRRERRLFYFFQGRVTISDQIFISKYLALMLKIGTGLLEAINILIADFSKASVKAVLLEIRASLERGDPFYSTFARYPKIFSPVYINLVRAGEASGNLEKTFEDLAETLTKQKQLRDDLRGSLIYPFILVVGSIAILAFIVSFALPKIAKVFFESGFQPPLFTRVVFGVGTFLESYGVYFLAIAVVGIILATRFYKHSLTFRLFIFGLVNEIPIIRDVIRKIALQRFAATLSSLIRAGMPITEALEITSKAVANAELKEAILRISREGLARGLTVGEAFRREPFFPQTVVNLMAISEKAGHLEEVLATLSDFYIKEIDASIKALVSFLEPILLLFIGFIIALIALSIIIPIYQLTTQF